MTTRWTICCALVASLVASLVAIFCIRILGRLYYGPRFAGLDICRKKSVGYLVMDSVTLWQFFETRVLQVKSTLLTMMGWIITLDVALIGFLLKQWISEESGSRTTPILFFLVVASIVGCLVNFWAEVLVWEYGGHIWRNTQRAGRARNVNLGLDAILGINENDYLTAGKLPKICKHLRRAIWVAVFFFLSSTLLAIVELMPETLLAIVELMPETLLAIVELMPETLLAIVELMPETLLAIVELIPEFVRNSLKLFCLCSN